MTTVNASDSIAMKVCLQFLSGIETLMVEMTPAERIRFSNELQNSASKVRGMNKIDYTPPTMVKVDSAPAFVQPEVKPMTTIPPIKNYVLPNVQLTGYFPPSSAGYKNEKQKRMEGGAFDRYGKPLRTLQQFDPKDPDSYVSIATDPAVIPSRSIKAPARMNHT